VIGIDLRNEIRKAHGLEPSWGDGVVRTDWKRAAERAGEIALKNAPHWLIFVGGINYQLDLTPVREKPISLSVENRVVYTGHFYGFSWMIPSWSGFTYENFRKRLYNSQLFVRGLGYPYVLG
jgi:endoglucanase